MCFNLETPTIGLLLTRVDGRTTDCQLNTCSNRETCLSIAPEVSTWLLSHASMLPLRSMSTIESRSQQTQCHFMGPTDPGFENTVLGGRIETVTGSVPEPWVCTSTFPSRHSSPTASSDTGPDTARDEEDGTNLTVVDGAHDLVHLLGPIGSPPRSGERGGAQRGVLGSCSMSSSTWEGRGSFSVLEACTGSRACYGLLGSSAQAPGPSVGFAGYTASLPPGPAACRGYGYRTREVVM
jgi:hypothetical protein